MGIWPKRMVNVRDVVDVGCGLDNVLASPVVDRALGMVDGLAGV